MRAAVIIESQDSFPYTAHEDQFHCFIVSLPIKALLNESQRPLEVLEFERAHLATLLTLPFLIATG